MSFIYPKTMSATEYPYTKIMDDGSRNNYKERSRIMINTVENIDWNVVKPQRGGVIVYTIYENNLYFGLGIDEKTSDISDFGGGIRYKWDETAVNGSLREFMEESLCVFGAYDADMIKKNVVLYSMCMMIVFLHLQVDTKRISELFNDRVKTNRNTEMSGMIWLTKDQFLNLIKFGTITLNNGTTHQLYYRVRKLLFKAKSLLTYL